VNYAEDLKRGFKTSLKRERLPLTLSVSVFFYILVSTLSFPQYSIQLLGKNIFYLDNAVVTLSHNTFKSAGLTGIVLSFMYSMLAGIAVTGIVGTVRKKGLKETKDLSAVMPGLAAAGCASCGVGFLALVGLGGSLALLPFEGNLLRALAVVILLAVIAKNGSKDLCSIDES